MNETRRKRIRFHSEDRIIRSQHRIMFFFVDLHFVSFGFEQRRERGKKEADRLSLCLGVARKERKNCAENDFVWDFCRNSFLIFFFLCLQYSFFRIHRVVCKRCCRFAFYLSFFSIKILPVIATAMVFSPHKRNVIIMSLDSSSYFLAFRWLKKFVSNEINM